MSSILGIGSRGISPAQTRLQEDKKSDKIKENHGRIEKNFDTFVSTYPSFSAEALEAEQETMFDYIGEDETPTAKESVLDGVTEDDLEAEVDQSLFDYMGNGPVDEAMEEEIMVVSDTSVGEAAAEGEVELEETDLAVDGDETDVEVDGDETDVEVDGDETDVEVDGDETDVEVDGDETDVEVDGDETDVEVDGDETDVEVDGDETDVEADDEESSSTATSAERVHGYISSLTDEDRAMLQTAYSGFLALNMEGTSLFDYLGDGSASDLFGMDASSYSNDYSSFDLSAFEDLLASLGSTESTDTDDDSVDDAEASDEALDDDTTLSEELIDELE